MEINVWILENIVFHMVMPCLNRAKNTRRTRLTAVVAQRSTAETSTTVLCDNKCFQNCQICWETCETTPKGPPFTSRELCVLLIGISQNFFTSLSCWLSMRLEEMADGRRNFEGCELNQGEAWCIMGTWPPLPGIAAQDEMTAPRAKCWYQACFKRFRNVYC